MIGTIGRKLGVSVLCAAALALTGPQLLAQPAPSAKHHGRAAVEFHDTAMHVVAAYYYSQRHHDSRWIVIQTALTTAQETVIHRNEIALRTPSGQEIPLASQTRIGEDVNKVEQLLQNAKVEAHDILSYFKQQDRFEDMQFFRLPFGPVVHDEFIVDRDHIATSPLFFESSSGAWAAGEYVLVIKHPNGVAELPLTLE